VEHLKVFPLGQVPALLSNWKGLPGTNTLAYYEYSKITDAIGLHHPLDGITNAEYKLLHFIQVTYFCKEKKAPAFNQDRCCHLVLCLWLILFHFFTTFGPVPFKCSPTPRSMPFHRKTLCRPNILTDTTHVTKTRLGFYIVSTKCLSAK
jgi:hypothetical protein